MLDRLFSDPLGALVAIVALCAMTVLCAIALYMAAAILRLAVNAATGRNAPDEAMWHALKTYAIGCRTAYTETGAPASRDAVDAILAHMVYLEGLYHPESQNPEKKHSARTEPR